MTQTQSEFKAEAKKEFNVAWTRDEARIKEAMTTKGTRLNTAALLLVKNVYELGFYSGLKTKIEWEE